MTKPQLIEEWWQEPGAGDQSMEDDHHDFWREVVEDVIDQDLTEKKILDFGCNQGGFLRYLHKSHAYRQAVGVDLAQRSVAVANQRKGDLPVQYLALDNLGSLDRDFDAATSTAVIYLVHDMADHAKQMFDRLKPGGVYYATHPDYFGIPGFATIRREIDRFGAVKAAPNTLEDIVKAFEAAGFSVELKRVTPKGYIKLNSASTWYDNVYDQIAMWYEHRYAFKCTKPA